MMSLMNYVVLRIFVSLSLFSSYYDLAAGETTNLWNRTRSAWARSELEPRTSNYIWELPRLNKRVRELLEGTLIQLEYISFS